MTRIKQTDQLPGGKMWKSRNTFSAMEWRIKLPWSVPIVLWRVFFPDSIRHRSITDILLKKNWHKILSTFVTIAGKCKTYICKCVQVSLHLQLRAAGKFEKKKDGMGWYSADKYNTMLHISCFIFKREPKYNVDSRLDVNYVHTDNQAVVSIKKPQG